MDSVAIICLIVAFVIVGGVGGYMIYAHSKDKWPFKKYERKNFPKGSLASGKTKKNEFKNFFGDLAGKKAEIPLT